MKLELHQLDLKYEALRVRDPAREQRLLASLGERGQQTPLQVTASGAADRYVLIDGYARVRALRALARDEVLVPLARAKPALCERLAQGCCRRGRRLGI
jgi:hypothetical protein